MMARTMPTRSSCHSVLGGWWLLATDRNWSMRFNVRPPRWYHNSANPATTKGVAERNADTSGNGDATASRTPITRPPTTTAVSDVSSSEDCGRNRRNDHVGQRNDLQLHHVGEKDAAYSRQHARDHPRPGIDTENRNADEPADLAVAGAPSTTRCRVEIEKQDHPDRDGETQAESDRMSRSRARQTVRKPKLSTASAARAAILPK